METLDPILSVAPERLIVAFESIAAMFELRTLKILFQSSGVPSLRFGMNGNDERFEFTGPLTDSR